MALKLSWTTYILCGLGVGYLINSCREEMIDYIHSKVEDDIELLKKLSVELKENNIELRNSEK